MGKKQRVKSSAKDELLDAKDQPLAADNRSIDPTLDALFTSSLPTAQPYKSKVRDLRDFTSVPSGQRSSDASNEESLGDGSVDGDDDSGVQLTPDRPVKISKSSKKRKHADNDDIEGAYLQKLVDEQTHDENRRKRTRREQSKTEAAHAQDDNQSSKSSSIDQYSDVENDFEKHRHETLTTTQAETEVEKASRTVFLGNVSTTCIKSKSSERELKEHLSSFLSDLPSSQKSHKIESIRFRSTAFSTASVPKKAAFAKKELMDATTQSTNAYVVYSTPLAAREAVKRLNGTMILDRHLRVDGVAHPGKVDHTRCVFVGNLGFVDDESNIRAAEGEDNAKKTKKSKPSGDVEEGLWRQFGKAGKVESVRVVRDKITRVGKGFAYVQFQSGTSVEKALLFNDKKFPPLLPRNLRVTRAKNITKTASHSNKINKKPQAAKERIYNPKASSQSQSMAGRAGKLLGRAGAAQYRNPASKDTGTKKSPEDIVFEGYRARGNQGKGTIFGKPKKKGKPTTRSSKRGAAFKASGSKKSRP